MANSGQRLARILATAAAPASPVQHHSGRSYFTAAGGTIDAPLADAQELTAAGYQLQFLVGTTAQRPAPSDADWASLPRGPGGRLVYWDTSISLEIVYDPSSATSWRRTDTFASA